MDNNIISNGDNTMSTYKNEKNLNKKNKTLGRPNVFEENIGNIVEKL